MNKTRWIAVGACTVSAFLAGSFLLAQVGESSEAALAWIKRVDGELKKPRYGKLTLEEMGKLEELQLGGHRKSDNKHLFVKEDEFYHLTALKGLKKLHLGENDGVTDGALVHVGKLTGLRSLVLWDAPMTDAGLMHLIPLKHLTHLDLAFATKISDAGLAHLVQLPDLEFLNLAGTKVSDVSTLKNLSKLKELRLGKLKVSGVAELKQGLPKLVVVSK